MRCAHARRCATNVVRTAGEKPSGLRPPCATLNPQGICPVSSPRSLQAGLSLLVLFIAMPAPSRKKRRSRSPPTSPTRRASSITPRSICRSTPGPLTLTTPKWIPGNHRPTGPVDEITGVVFTANGKPLAWRRDDVDLYQFHLTVPQGVTTLHAHLDCIVTARVTQKLAVLEWEKLLLYPANTPVRDIPIQPSVIVPAGWGIGTALTPLGSGAYPVPAPGAITHFAVDQRGAA